MNCIPFVGLITYSDRTDRYVQYYASISTPMMLPRGSVDGSRNVIHVLKMPRNMCFYSVFYTWSVNQWDLWEGHRGKPGWAATGFYCCLRLSKF